MFLSQLKNHKKTIRNSNYFNCFKQKEILLPQRSTGVIYYKHYQFIFLDEESNLSNFQKNLKKYHFWGDIMSPFGFWSHRIMSSSDY